VKKKKHYLGSLLYHGWRKSSKRGKGQDEKGGVTQDQNSFEVGREEG